MTEEVAVPVRELPLATATTAAACCGIGVEGGLTREQAEASATLLKAVADPVRLRLLSAIRATDAGEACVCDLTPLVGLSQPTVSHHLKVLVEAGLLEREKRGPWAWFRLVPARLDDVAAIFR
ncbi:metalloregulator ArsR/SmtB family transcription factor [Nostocoides sp. Soil756]|jgi:ArsR family transcriptional regulator|uniref:ArsR/SmtB family transcription factor n=1 Tax=Nostocoides sp. Soil756 TaxID=1736399 RepID=UPI0006FB5626|nr:metalloregulator ArsR/SmtB family transcription factor [Tetrasphaera sp. Soil756]KRE60628.1 transcriptional regulator [Tetrasphaera sp. Soil756]